MEITEVVDLGRKFFFTALMLVTPAVGVSLVVGLVISIFQTITSIQEQTLTFAPRILAVGAIICATLPWTLTTLIDFTRYVLAELLRVAL